VKARHLRGFLEEFLLTQGAKTERRGDHLLAVRLPRKLSPVVGVKDLVLAFTLEGLKDDPRSELATVGNPVFDRILELARSGGRAGERYEKVPGRKGKPPDPLERFRILGAEVRLGAPRPVYTPLYYLLFRVEYSREDVADELEVVPVDAVSLQTLPQMPELVDQWTGLETAPAAGRDPAPAYPISDRVIRAALRLLEKRLRRRLARIRKDSDAHLARETDSISAYYSQLIAETRNAGRRWTLSAEGREERIRLLQLDWKRRTEEAQQAWHPHLDVYWTAAAAVQRPRLAFDVLLPRGREGARGRAPRATRRKGGAPAAAGAGGGAGSKSPAFFFDELDRAFLEPACLRCATPGLSEVLPVEGGFLCPRCARQKEAPEEGNGGGR